MTNARAEQLYQRYVAAMTVLKAWADLYPAAVEMGWNGRDMNSLGEILQKAYREYGALDLEGGQEPWRN